MNNGYNDKSGQLKEIDEAIRMGNDVLYDIDEAIKSLGKAKNWATYDMISKGGLFSHLFKYDNVEKAKDAMSGLEHKLKRFEKELADVNSHLDYSLNEYSTGLKAMDYFFDNIFTDYHVRSKISEDKESLIKLKENINSILSVLRNKRMELEKK